LRRLTKIVATTAVLALAVAGCANKNDNASGDSGALCDATGKGPKIGLAYDVGGEGDKSFNDSATAGVRKAVEELDATCEQSEATDGEPDSAKEERLRTLADAGFNPIVAVGAAYAEEAQTVAKEYPDVKFAVIDGFTEAPNLTNLVFAAEQGAYLVGMAAGLKTETDHIGFVGGVPGPVIDPFRAGYEAGAKAVNPKIKIDAKYLSDALDDKAFKNPSGAKTAADGMFDAGADVVFHAAGLSGNGVIESAVANDGWAIGVDSDQYLTASAEEKEHILTSSLKRVDIATFDYLKAFDEGNVKAGFDLYDMKRDGVGYATSGGFVDDIKDQLDEAKQKIIDGQVQVPNKL